LALHHVQKGNKGQVIDVALYESVFNITESLLPEYDAHGVIRGRSGSTLPGIAPSNLYPCRDGSYVLIAGNADALFKRLMSAIGRDDLREDPALARNDGRAAQMARIDEAISAWTSKRAQQDVLEEMERAQVPAGRIYTAADIAADPHYAARGMIQDVVAGDGEALKVPGIVPKLSLTPGALRTPAPKLGEHTEQVLASIGCSRDEISRLREQKII
jgi:formyl-CoA transferase